MTFRGSRSLVLVALAACGDGSSHPPVAEDDLVPQLADTVCDLQERCDCETTLTAEQCRAAVEAALEMYVLPAESLGLTYDPQCGGDALGIYQELGCGDIEDAVDTDACRPCKLYFGNQRAGEACMRFDDTIYDDCAPGLLCDGEVCVDPCDRASEGESCLGRPCAEGLVCSVTADPQTGDPVGVCAREAGLGESCAMLPCGDQLDCDVETMTCRELPGVGEPCTGSCREGSWCDTSGDAGMWTCAAPKPEGQPCSGSHECASDSCDPQTQTCAPAQPFVCEIAG